MINTFFIGQLGDEAEIDRLELKVNWRMKHEFGETFALGVEGDSEIEDLAYVGTKGQKRNASPARRFVGFSHKLTSKMFQSGLLRVIPS
jgi:hypothetical protein